MYCPYKAAFKTKRDKQQDEDKKEGTQSPPKYAHPGDIM
jgi:hypothetical protein